MDTDKLVLDNLYAVLMACNRADSFTMETDTAETIQKLLLADCTSAEDATAVRNSVVRLLGEQKKAAYEYATLREERSVQLEYKSFKQDRCHVFRLACELRKGKLT